MSHITLQTTLPSICTEFSQLLIVYLVFLSDSQLFIGSLLTKTLSLDQNVLILHMHNEK
jgi:hypothetical protein